MADHLCTIPLRARTAKRFITSSKSKLARRPSFKKCRAVFAVSLLSVAKATSCLNTSCCERLVASKTGGASALLRTNEKPRPEATGAKSLVCPARAAYSGRMLGGVNGASPPSPRGYYFRSCAVLGAGVLRICLATKTQRIAKHAPAVSTRKSLTRACLVGRGT